MKTFSFFGHACGVSDERYPEITDAAFELIVAMLAGDSLCSLRYSDKLWSLLLDELEECFDTSIQALADFVYSIKVDVFFFRDTRELFGVLGAQNGGDE